jgi:3-oxoacyl-[acyl-carrier-protein] synthase-3
MYKAKIRGTGSYLPEKQLTNKDLELMVETSDAWIYERTGIRTRRIAAEGVGTSDLAYEASLRALESADLPAKELDLVILATVVADQPVPTGSCMLQEKLQIPGVPCFDLGAACTGFVYASSVAQQFIQTGMYKNILVVGAEVLSRIVNYKDRETCILFGDAAGAAVYSRTDDNDTSELLSAHLHAEGQLREIFEIFAGGTKMPNTHETLDKGLNFMKMKGREIFKHAVRTMARCCQEALVHNKVSIDQVKWIIPHQANIRIMEGVANQLDFPMERVINVIENMGNTSAATIPVAMDMAIRDGRLKRGDLILLVSFGAGLTSGSMLLRY